MSIFLPYNVNEVILTFENWFNIDLSLISDYQRIIITLGANLYFFVFWFVIIWVVLKSINWVYTRIC